MEWKKPSRKSAGIDLNSIREAIQVSAVAHGFDLCRIAQPDIPTLHAEALRSWLDAGRHGDMA